MSFLFPADRSYEITENFRLGRQGYLFIPLTRPIYLKEGDAAIYSLYGRIHNYDSERRTINHPSGSVYGSNTVTNWYVIQRHDMHDFFHSKKSAQEKLKLLVKIPFEIIDADKIEVLR